MDDNYGEWVESMGVVSRRWVWLVVGFMGVVRIYNNYIGVVSGCCCKEVYI